MKLPANELGAQSPEGQARMLISCALFLAALSFGCHRAPKSSANGSSAPVPRSELRTIDSVDPRPVVMDPPPMLRDEAAPPKPTGQPWEVQQPVPLTPEDVKVRAALPFAPAIALDPIDGSKLSILANTPTYEYKGHIYYFSSVENKNKFAATPDQYAKGIFKGV
jgi:YHS domain-containing protein